MKKFDYRTQKVNLVTGGAGFLGRHLVKTLIKRDEHVIVADNFFTGSKHNLEEFQNHKNFEIIRHDINFPLYLEVDQIYNLACPASPIHYQWNPIQTVKTSVIGTTNMLGLAKRLGISIFHASTSEIYGDPIEHPQKESYWGNVNPIGPRSCYDEGKRCAETLCADYSRQLSLDVRMARIFNTYGPYMHPNDGRVVSNFVTQALSGKDITMYGDGLQTRSFCFVDDLIDGIYKLANIERKRADLVHPLVCNLGNPVEFTMIELANLVIKLTDSRSKIVFQELPENDPTQRKPDISKAKALLDWQPNIALEEGLQRTIHYFKNVN